MVRGQKCIANNNNGHREFPVVTNHRSRRIILTPANAEDARTCPAVVGLFSMLDLVVGFTLPPELHSAVMVVPALAFTLGGVVVVVDSASDIDGV